MDDLGTVARRAVPWAVVGKWVPRLLGLVVLVVLARIIRPSDFGSFSFASSVLAMSGAFADLGLGRAMVWREDLHRRDIDTAFCISACAGVLVCFGIASTATLAGSLSGDANTHWVILSLAPVALVQALAVVPQGLTERALRFDALALRASAAAVLSAIVGITAALLGAGVWALVLKAGVQAVVTTVTLYALVPVRPRLRWHGPAAVWLWSYGGRLALADVLNQAALQSDVVVVGWAFSTTVLGYYSLALQILWVLTDLFTSVVSSLALATLSRLAAERDRFKEWLYFTTNLSTWISVPVFSLALISAPVAIQLVLGREWLPVVPYFQLMATMGAMSAVTYFDDSALAAAGRPGLVLTLSVGQTALRLALVATAAFLGPLFMAGALVLNIYGYWPVRVRALVAATGISWRRYVAGWATPVGWALPLVGAGLLLVPGSTSLMAAVGWLVALVAATAAWFALGLRLLHPSVLAAPRALATSLAPSTTDTPEYFSDGHD